MKVSRKGIPRHVKLVKTTLKPSTRGANKRGITSTANRLRTEVPMNDPNPADLIIGQAYVQQFAKWCAAWAGEEPDTEFLRDYVNNYTVIFNDDWFRVIDVAMGNFDHGAGNALLIIQGNTAWVAYEGKMTLFSEGKELRSMP
jgi:hypothetical protein